MGFIHFFTEHWKCTSHTLNWFIFLLLLIKVMVHHSLSLLVFLVPLVWRGNLLWRQFVAGGEVSFLSEMGVSAPQLRTVLT